MKLKNRPFFVIGLPRSRTAWLANFLTTGSSFCFHEALRYVNHIDKLPALLETAQNDEPAEFVGNSDSSMVFAQNWLTEHYPEAHYVFVRRDLWEVIESYRREFPKINIDAGTWYHMGLAYDRFESSMLGTGKAVQFWFRQLEDEAVQRDIFSFCLPGKSIGTYRQRQLDCLRVDTILEKCQMHPEIRQKLKRFQSVLP